MYHQAEAKRSDLRLNAASMLIAALLAILLYGRSLHFGFFNDDPTGNFAWMAGQSISDLFTSSAGYGFYRPVVFVLWKVLAALVGGYAPFAFHAVSLIVHGLNAALLWQLAYTISQRRAYAWLVTLIFAVIPFNYEAVAYVAALFHPIITFWTLLALWLYRRARLSQSPIYMAAAHLVLLLGLFSHENGLFIPFALVGMEWLLFPPRSRQIKAWAARPFLPFFIPAALFAALWFAIPKAGEQSLPTLNGISSNMLPALQTVVYPLLPLFRLDTGRPFTLWLLAGGTVGVLLFLTSRIRRVPLFAFGAGWIAFSAAPSILALNSDYFYGSPRLHYLPSVGVALLWGLPLLWAVNWGRAGETAVAALLIIAIGWPPLSFIRCELDFYEQASRIVHQMGRLGNETPPEKEMIFVNLPFFFSSYDAHPDGCPNPYRWTPVGAVIMPPYASARDFVRFNGGMDRTVTAVTVPDYAPGWIPVGQETALAALRAEMGETAVYIFQLGDGTFFDLTKAWRPDQEIIPSTALFSDEIGLTASHIEQNEGGIVVETVWQVKEGGGRPLTLFIHLYDQSGALAAQQDGLLAEGFVPSQQWQTGDLITDQREVKLPPALAAGQYRLAVGLYDPINGERLPATADAVPLADDVYTLEQILIK